MKRGGILHPELSAHLARLGHTDTFVIGDAGLPVPPGVARVDLAVSLGVARFRGGARRGARRGRDGGSGHRRRSGGLPGRSDALCPGCPAPRRCRTRSSRQLTGEARFVVRTGETTPYANVILRCGVPF